MTDPECALSCAAILFEVLGSQFRSSEPNVVHGPHAEKKFVLEVLMTEPAMF